MPRYQPSEEELVGSEVTLRGDVTTDDVIRGVYEADRIVINEKTALRLIGEHPNWNAKQIASWFVCDQLTQDFEGAFGDRPYDPDEVPDCFE